MAVIRFDTEYRLSFNGKLHQREKLKENAKHSPNRACRRSIFTNSVPTGIALRL